MANADRNDLKTDAIEKQRNQREEAVKQPGARGTPEREHSPEEARREAEQRYGKTGMHAGPDRPPADAP